MGNIKTIFSREFAAYFNSPIAYIFIIVFLAVNSGLFITSFFLAGTADMRGFFALLPITLIIFIPAISMRLWAEDTKGGTIALLHSFPITSSQLVLGKFLASYLFYLVTLAGTLVIPVMIGFLGNPDFGPIIGGYFGAALLGGFYLSLGIFLSGLFKDQITAFILSMVGCFLFYMVGTNYIAIIIDGWLGGFGSLLMQAFGTATHFSSIERGVLDIRDIIYFMSYTFLFLWLNAVTVEQIMRRLADKKFAINAVISLAVVFLLNVVIGGFNFGRFDLTEGNIYTVSSSSKNILSKLKDAPITIRYYVSPKDKMPPMMKNLEQDVSDLLREFELVSERLKFEVIDPTADVDMTESLQEKGINPFDTRSIEKDSYNIKRIYSSIAVSYLDKPEEIIPQVVPQNLYNLEYDLLSRIYRMTMPEKPTVVVMAPYDVSRQDPRMRQMMQQMGQQVSDKEDRYKSISQVLQSENYNVVRVEGTKDDPIPDSFDLMVVMASKALSDRQRYEINKALVSGKDVILAAQQFSFNYQPVPGQGIQVTPANNRLAVNDLIEQYGLALDDEILMDANMEVLSIPTRQTIGGFLQATVETPDKLPNQIKITDQNRNPDNAITNRVASVLYLWGNAIDINETKLAENGLEYETLFSSSPSSWTMPSTGAPLSGSDITPDNKQLSGAQPLAVMLTGQFPNAYAGISPPAWPDPGDLTQASAPVETIVENPSKLIMYGCSEMFSDQVLGAVGNSLLLLNSVDGLALGDDLISIRTKMITQRFISEVSTTSKMFWKFFVAGLVPIILIIIGVSRMVIRRNRREAYIRLLEQSS